MNNLAHFLQLMTPEKTITAVSSTRASPMENEVADCHASIRNDMRDRSEMFGAPPPKFSRGGGSFGDR